MRLQPYTVCSARDAATSFKGAGIKKPWFSCTRIQWCISVMNYLRTPRLSSMLQTELLQLLICPELARIF